MNVNRPLGIAIVAIFLVVNSAMLFVQLFADTPLATRIQTLDDLHPWSPALYVVIAGLSLLVAVGLWTGRRWAWGLGMLVVGISLVASLILYTRGDPPYPRMAIDVVIAFYLNQGAVRAYFERQRTSAAADRPSPS